MSPFEAAWALLKADVYMAPDSSVRGFAASGAAKDKLISENKLMYNPKGLRARGREMWSPNTEQWELPDNHPLAFGIIDPEDLALSRQTYPNKIQYYRGGSMPRVNQRGNFIGVNVASPKFDWENAFEQAAQDFGATAAHENIHDLINDDINEWAKQQSGVGQLQPLLSAMREERLAGLEGFERFNTSMEMDRKETDTPYAELRDLAQARQKNMLKLREMGHEYGAFSGMSPDMTQEEVYNRMLNYKDINPYVHYSMLQQMPNLAAGFAGDPGTNPAYLHTGDPNIYPTTMPL